MYRPGSDLPQFRAGGILPAAPSPQGAMNMGPAFVSPPIPGPPPIPVVPPMPGRAFLMPQYSRGLPGFPAPPPLPPSLLRGQTPPFVPPLPQSPPSEFLPPPPPAGLPPSPPPPPVEESNAKLSLPPEPPRPNDPEMLKNIEVLAAFVAANGPQFESMARAKHAGDPKFAFLFESDVGPEAAVGHEFYKWKKQTLELQTGLEADNRGKCTDQGKFPGRGQQANHMSGQTVLQEEAPDSPTMSDMDTEDDFVMLSPKRESVKQLADSKLGSLSLEPEGVNLMRAAAYVEAENFSQGKTGAPGVEKLAALPRMNDHRVRSDVLLKRATWEIGAQAKQPFEKNREYSESLWPKPPKPRYAEMVKKIEAMAASVVKHGVQIETLAQSKHMGDSRFAFLFESDLSADAVIGREFYKWKKQSLELQLRVRAENKKPELDEEFPESLNMSDVDMEDMEDDISKGDAMWECSQDAEHLSPRKGTTTCVEADKSFQNKAGTTMLQEFLDRPEKQDHPVVSDGLSKRDVESKQDPVKAAPIMSKRRSNQGRYTDDHTGLIMDNSFSDTSDALGDWEPRERAQNAGSTKWDIGRSKMEQSRQKEHGVVILDQTENISPLKSISQYADKLSPRSPDSPVNRDISVPEKHGGRKASRWGSPHQIQRAEKSKTYEKSGLINMHECFQAGGERTGEDCVSPSRSHRLSDASDTSKDLERPINPDKPGDGGLEDIKSGSDAHEYRDWEALHVDEFGRLVHAGTSESDSDKDQHPLTHKRRSFSRSRTRSRSRSSECSRWRRQSFSRSPHRRGKWRSCSRSPQWQRSSSRTPPRDLRCAAGYGRGDWDWRGDCEFQERGRRGGRGSAPNICIYYARGRCSRGSSCRFLHQDRKVTAQEQEFWMHEDQVEEPETVVSVENVQVNREVNADKPEVEAIQESKGFEERNAEFLKAEGPVLGTEMIAVDTVEVHTEDDTEQKIKVKADVSEKPQVSIEANNIQKAGPDLGIEGHGQAKVITAKEPQLKRMVDTTEQLDAETGVECSLLPEYEPRGQYNHIEDSQVPAAALASLPVVCSPLLLSVLQPKPIGQPIHVGDSSLTGQQYLSSSQMYPPIDSAINLQQHSSLHAPSGTLPPYAEPGSIRQLPNNPIRNTGPVFLTGNSNPPQPFPVGNRFSGPQPGFISGNPGPLPYPTDGAGSGQQSFLPGPPMHEMLSVSQHLGPPIPPSYGISSTTQPGFSQNWILTHNQSVFPPQNQPLSFRSNPPSFQQHPAPIMSSNTFTTLEHGLSSSLPLPTYHESLFPYPIGGDSSKQFTFTNSTKDGLQDAYSRPLLTPSAPTIQSTMPWMLPRSLDSPVPPESALPPTTGRSSSYSYLLTSIPPLSNLIKFPGVSDLSTSGDQYDPLSDSLDPAPSAALKSMSYGSLKQGEDGAMSNTMMPHLENVSPSLEMEKAHMLSHKVDNVEAEFGNQNEATADPGVGIVENVSPPDDTNKKWSPGQPVDGAEAGQDEAHLKRNSRGLKLLRSAVAEYVKEVLKPTWREGRMSRDAFKTIVKKAVDKVTGSLPSHHVPKSQEKVDQFMASSRSKVSKLVQGYVDKYLKA